MLVKWDGSMTDSEVFFRSLSMLLWGGLQLHHHTSTTKTRHQTSNMYYIFPLKPLCFSIPIFFCYNWPTIWIPAPGSSSLYIPGWAAPQPTLHLPWKWLINMGGKRSIFLFYFSIFFLFICSSDIIYWNCALFQPIAALPYLDRELSPAKYRSFFIPYLWQQKNVFGMYKLLKRVSKPKWGMAC